MINQTNPILPAMLTTLEVSTLSFSQYVSSDHDQYIGTILNNNQIVTKTLKQNCIINPKYIFMC